MNLATEDIYKELSVLTATGEAEQMIRLLRNHHALSQVITTLIILVVAILLASVLVYFAVNVVSTNVQQEDLSATNAHIWVNADDQAEGAIMVSNIGGRDVVINQIEVRGVPCSWDSVFYLYANTTDVGLTERLPYLTYPVDAEAVTSNGTQLFANHLVATSGQLILPSGGVMVIYINSPQSVSINDIGTTIGITVFTAQAMYQQETNVQAAQSA